MKRTFLLFSIVVAFAMLLAGYGVSVADDQCTQLPDLPSPGKAAPPRTCQISLSKDGLKYVTIDAGPDTTTLAPGSLVSAFPRQCKNNVDPGCTCDPSSLYCSEWKYRWTITGFDKANLNSALVSADADITVFSSYPAGAKVLQPLIAQGERFLDFSVDGGKQFTASYFTPLNVTSGTLTAGFVGKSGIIPLLGRCALAGASNGVIPQGQATTNGLTRNSCLGNNPSTGAPICCWSYQIDPTTGLVISDSTMTFTYNPSDVCTTLPDVAEPVQINGHPAAYSNLTEWLAYGSCNYIYVDSQKKQKTIACPTCKIVNGVCVP
jgi:hypothetical protein